MNIFDRVSSAWTGAKRAVEEKALQEKADLIRMRDSEVRKLNSRIRELEHALRQTCHENTDLKQENSRLLSLIDNDAQNADADETATPITPAAAIQDVEDCELVLKSQVQTFHVGFVQSMSYGRIVNTRIEDREDTLERLDCMRRALAKLTLAVIKCPD